MGYLKNGEWHDEWAHNDEDSGEFERDESAFRSWITPEGSPGPTGEAAFPPKPGVIASISASPARGRIAPMRCAI